MISNSARSFIQLDYPQVQETIHDVEQDTRILGDFLSGKMPDSLTLNEHTLEYFKKSNQQFGKRLVEAKKQGEAQKAKTIRGKFSAKETVGALEEARYEREVRREERKEGRAEREEKKKMLTKKIEKLEKGEGWNKSRQIIEDRYDEFEVEKVLYNPKGEEVVLKPPMKLRVKKGSKKPIGNHSPAKGVGKVYTNLAKENQKGRANKTIREGWDEDLGDVNDCVTRRKKKNHHTVYCNWMGKKPKTLRLEDDSPTKSEYDLHQEETSYEENIREQPVDLTDEENKLQEEVGQLAQEEDLFDDAELEEALRQEKRKIAQEKVAASIRKLKGVNFLQDLLRSKMKAMEKPEERREILSKEISEDAMKKIIELVMMVKPVDEEEDITDSPRKKKKGIPTGGQPLSNFKNDESTPESHLDNILDFIKIAKAEQEEHVRKQKERTGMNALMQALVNVAESEPEEEEESEEVVETPEAEKVPQWNFPKLKPVTKSPAKAPAKPLQKPAPKPREKPAIISVPPKGPETIEIKVEGGTWKYEDEELLPVDDFILVDLSGMDADKSGNNEQLELLSYGDDNPQESQRGSKKLKSKPSGPGSIVVSSLPPMEEPENLRSPLPSNYSSIKQKSMTAYNESQLEDEKLFETNSEAHNIPPPGSVMDDNQRILNESARGSQAQKGSKPSSIKGTSSKHSKVESQKKNQAPSSPISPEAANLNMSLAKSKQSLISVSKPQEAGVDHTALSKASNGSNVASKHLAASIQSTPRSKAPQESPLLRKPTLASSEKQEKEKAASIKTGSNYDQK